MNKYDTWIIRSLGAFVPIMTYVMFNMLIDFRSELTHLQDTKANKINTLTFMSYGAIEVARSAVVSELFCEFGRMIRVKEEELEPFRIIANRKLNRSIKSGTTRGK